MNVFSASRHGWIGSALCTVAFLLSSMGPAPASAASGEDPYADAHEELGMPPSPTGRRLAGVVMMLRDQDLAKAQAFLDAASSPSLEQSHGPGELVRKAQMIWTSLGDFEITGVMKTGATSGEAVIEDTAGARIRIALVHEAEAPYRIESLELGPADRRGPEIPELGSVEDADRLLTQLAAKGEFGGVLLVALGGEVVFERGYGLAHRASGRAITPETRFNVGSITKDLTRAAILQLEAAGKLSRDDRLGKFLPRFPAGMAEHITVRHLLEMSSGLGDYHDAPEWQERRHELQDLDDLLDVISKTELLFEPGQGESYSNSGYAVLGGVIAAASGMSFYQYMADHVFAKAGMTGSGFLTERDESVAMGYTRMGGGPESDWQENDAHLPIKGSPAGSSYSTARDLLKFYLAQRSGALAAGDEAARPGCWAGGGPGVSTVACHELAEGQHVIVLSNVDPPVGERVGAALAKALAKKLVRRGSKAP